MPGAWKWQPAPGRARGFRVQDTVERHDGVKIVVEKVLQWEPENPSANGREMIDDFRLWGSSRCRCMGEYSIETKLFTWVVHTLDNHNASLSEGGAPPRCGRKLPRNAASPPSLSLLAPSRPPSWEGQKRAAGVMGGPGERSPGSGFEGAGAPRQPQCITLGRLAPPKRGAAPAPLYQPRTARRARGVHARRSLASPFRSGRGESVLSRV